MNGLRQLLRAVGAVGAVGASEGPAPSVEVGKEGEKKDWPIIVSANMLPLGSIFPAVNSVAEKPILAASPGRPEGDGLERLSFFFRDMAGMQVSSRAASCSWGEAAAEQEGAYNVGSGAPQPPTVHPSSAPRKHAVQIIRARASLEFLAHLEKDRIDSVLGEFTCGQFEALKLQRRQVASLAKDLAEQAERDTDFLPVLRAACYIWLSKQSVTAMKKILTADQFQELGLGDAEAAIANFLTLYLRGSIQDDDVAQVWPITKSLSSIQKRKLALTFAPIHWRHVLYAENLQVGEKMQRWLAPISSDERQCAFHLNKWMWLVSRCVPLLIQNEDKACLVDQRFLQAFEDVAPRIGLIFDLGYVPNSFMAFYLQKKAKQALGSHEPRAYAAVRLSMMMMRTPHGGSLYGNQEIKLVDQALRSHSEVDQHKLIEVLNDAEVKWLHFPGFVDQIGTRVRAGSEQEAIELILKHALPKLLAYIQLQQEGEPGGALNFRKGIEGFPQKIIPSTSVLSQEEWLHRLRALAGERKQVTAKSASSTPGR
jgi:hypothetical protein